MAHTPSIDTGNVRTTAALPRRSPCCFYIDIAGHPDTDNVRHALEELRKACGFFKILGTYPVDVH